MRLRLQHILASAIVALGGSVLTAGAVEEPRTREAPPPDQTEDEAPGAHLAPPVEELDEGPDSDDERPRGRRFGLRSGRARGMDWGELSEQERERIEHFIEKHFPARYAEFKELDRTAPRAFERAINQMLPQMQRLMRMERDDPEAFPLRLEEVKTSLEIRALMRRILDDAEPGVHDRLREEARALLERRFDIQQRLHRAEIERLERRLAQARTLLERRQADKEEIIARELEDVSSGRMPPPGPPEGPRDRRRPDGPPP